jgi:hypothetical protein
LHFLQDQEFGGGGHGPDEEGGTVRGGGNGAYGEWAVDENATNFEATKAWNGRNGNTFLANACVSCALLLCMPALVQTKAAITQTDTPPGRKTDVYTHRT